LHGSDTGASTQIRVRGLYKGRVNTQLVCAVRIQNLLNFWHTYKLQTGGAEVWGICVCSQLKGGKPWSFALAVGPRCSDLYSNIPPLGVKQCIVSRSKRAWYTFPLTFVPYWKSRLFCKVPHLDHFKRKFKSSTDPGAPASVPRHSVWQNSIRKFKHVRLGWAPYLTDSLSSIGKASD
jgi:hypothetical protein